jgi:5-methyltetrahydropteroyltriglutamate--homocysteine methyltransferase
MTATVRLAGENHQPFSVLWRFEQGQGYAPVAKALLGHVAADGFFVEYDSERSGGFEPLALAAEDKVIVLGLISTKAGTLESGEWIKQRIHEASRQIGLDRLCLSPQCGFASTEEGNRLTIAEQWRKLALVSSIANEMWG